MDCIFDKEKLCKVLSDFYSSTGIAITLYDTHRQTVATSPVYTEYCSCIRKKEECKENCDRSNLSHMETARESRGRVCYTCHAGLMEMITPIEYEGEVIAYLQIGQFRDAEGIYSSPSLQRESAVRYGLDVERMHALYERLPEISGEKLLAVCNIMEILVKSFWNDGLIDYNRSMLSVKIERYIAEHLTGAVHLDDLCREFFLSKNALYRLFREEFGTTVNEYIVQKRLHLARELLVTEPKLNVTEVASRCGFADYNYFIRLFKQKNGSAPLQYRKQNQRKTNP